MMKISLIIIIIIISNTNNLNSYGGVENEESMKRPIINSSEGIYFSVRSAVKYHSTRLPSIILTWLQNIHPSQIHLITDKKDAQADYWLKIAVDEGLRVIYSECPIGYERYSLCCKTGVEYEYYYREKKRSRWFCHFDDDIYVNVPMLVSTLSKYNPLKDKVYIGRWPREVDKLSRPEELFRNTFLHYERETYQYATGAAYYISDLLMAEVEKYFRDPQFPLNCEKMRLEDDMFIGCVIVAVLGLNFTNNRLFNSNLDSMVSLQSLKEQVTVSYGVIIKVRRKKRVVIPNRLAIPGSAFSEKEDPTRFFSYHCYLYPDIEWCKN